MRFHPEYQAAASKAEAEAITSAPLLVICGREELVLEAMSQHQTAGDAAQLHLSSLPADASQRLIVGFPGCGPTEAVSAVREAFPDWPEGWMEGGIVVVATTNLPGVVIAVREIAHPDPSDLGYWACLRFNWDSDLNRQMRQDPIGWLHRHFAKVR